MTLYIVFKLIAYGLGILATWALIDEVVWTIKNRINKNSTNEEA